MSEISDLYDEVMSDQEKTAAAHDVGAGNGPDFDAHFFDKIASGDEEATAELNDIIDAARAEGASDEEIEDALAEAMSEANSAGDQQIGADDDFEVAKAAAYQQGTEQAVADVLESNLAKVAGVTFEDLANYELGGDFAMGYAEARAELDEAVEKIAAHKEAASLKGAKDFVVGAARKAGDRVKGAGNRYLQLMKGGAPGVGTAGKRSGNTMAGFKGEVTRSEALKSLGARVGTGAGVVGLGGAGYAATRKKK